MAASSLEADFRAREAKSRLGSVALGPLRLEPAPLRFYAGSIALLVVAALLAAGAIAVWLSSKAAEIDAVVALAVAAVAFAAPAVALLVRRAASRASLTLHENGLLVERNARSAAIPFDDVETVTLREKAALNQGVRVGVERTLRLKGPRLSRTLRAFHRDDAGPDSLAPFLTALFGSIADAASRRLAAGGALAGKGWRLDAAGITSKAARESVPLGALAASGRFEERLCLWRAHEEAPFFAVPESSPNAPILEVLAGRVLQSKPARAESEGLGRLLFRKGARRLPLALGAAFGLLLLGPGVGILVSKGAEEETVIGVTMVVAGAAVLALVAWSALTSTRIHERGAVRKSPFGGRVVRFDEATRLRYSATRQYVHGAYAGTVVDLFLGPEPPGKGVRLRTTVKGSDADLDALRDLLASRLAERMHHLFTSAGEVPWTKRFRFTRAGIVYTPVALFGKAKTRTVAWSPDIRYRMANGVFALLDPTNPKKAIGSVSCGEENFYPGFALLFRLVAEIPKKAATGSSGTAEPPRPRPS